MKLLPHQQRVVTERDELNTKINALEKFIESPLFAQLDLAEQNRLKGQNRLMVAYADVLTERIVAFPVPSDEELSKVTELNPELAGTPVFKNEVPVGAKPIEDINTFAMMVDYWHGQCMEHGNRLLEIPEGTTISVEDAAKPGEVVEMDLNGAYLQVFRTGVLTALQVFKDLPFGVSVEEQADDNAG
jgi:hypothetical protein